MGLIIGFCPRNPARAGCRVEPTIVKIAILAAIASLIVKFFEKSFAADLARQIVNCGAVLDCGLRSEWGRYSEGRAVSRYGMRF